jgi:NAD(P)-dependent dehydrogenase (short-subunit alcohol dehydrogenase family)
MPLDGVAVLGRVDFVLANAGILPVVGEKAHDIAAYVDAVDVMLNGVCYTNRGGAACAVGPRRRRGHRDHQLHGRVEQLMSTL